MIMRVVCRAAMRSGGWIKRHWLILGLLGIYLGAQVGLLILSEQDRAARDRAAPPAMSGEAEAAMVVAAQFGKELCLEAAATASITNCTPIIFGAQEVAESDGTEIYVALAMTGRLNGKPANQPLMVVIRDGRVVYVAS